MRRECKEPIDFSYIRECKESNECSYIREWKESNECNYIQECEEPTELKKNQLGRHLSARELAPTADAASAFLVSP